ncbi:hypothetical protein MXD95_027990 [Frankia sp. AiPa1]|nr:hypothetical protein [Frankia sp. AiPa1]MCL9763015.1 hypothetical protein [Frankia sp. AiPa1]
MAIFAAFDEHHTRLSLSDVARRAELPPPAPRSIWPRRPGGALPGTDGGPGLGTCRELGGIDPADAHHRRRETALQVAAAGISRQLGTETARQPCHRQAQGRRAENRRLDPCDRVNAGHG